jgi:hypothetical protein
MKHARALSGALLAGLLLALPAGAVAKEPTAMTICGSSGCRQLERSELSWRLLPLGQRSTPRSEQLAGWYRARIGIGDTTLTTIVMPSSGYLRNGANNDDHGPEGWFRMRPTTARAYARATSGLRPFAAAALPLGDRSAEGSEGGARTTAVSRTVTAAPAALSEESDSGGTPWAPIAASGALLLGIFTIRQRLRHRA